MRTTNNISQVSSVAKLRNLCLLSASYKKETAPLLWKCLICNFTFYKTFRQIKNNTTSKNAFEKIANNIKCDKCREAYILNFLNDIAKNHKNSKNHGKLLSKTYKTLKTTYTWQCENLHIWKTTAGVILRSYWCPKCTKYTIKLANKIAKYKGGKCLSKNCKNSNSILLWQCKFGHKWKTTLMKAVSGRWCKICSSSLSERLVRACFEQIFNKPFPNLKPIFLKINNKSFQLDGYCEELSLAFEHNGIQHYEDCMFTSKRSLKIIQDADKFKAIKCKENNVKLIIIPPLRDVLHISQLKQFIIDSCKRLNVGLPTNIDSIKINYSAAYKTSTAYEQLKKIKQIVKYKNGKLLSTAYVNSTTPIKIKCENGHVFYKTPNELNYTWCPHCSPTKRKDMSFINNFANSKNIKCLSCDYKNNRILLKWKCNVCEQIWFATYKAMKRSFTNNNIVCKNELCSNHKGKNNER